MKDFLIIFIFYITPLIIIILLPYLAKFFQNKGSVYYNPSDIIINRITYISLLLLGLLPVLNIIAFLFILCNLIDKEIKPKYKHKKLLKIKESIETWLSQEIKF